MANELMLALAITLHVLSIVVAMVAAAGVIDKILETTNSFFAGLAGILVIAAFFLYLAYLPALVEVTYFFLFNITRA